MSIDLRQKHHFSRCVLLLFLPVSYQLVEGRNEGNQTVLLITMIDSCARPCCPLQWFLWPNVQLMCATVPSGNYVVSALEPGATQSAPRVSKLRQLYNSDLPWNQTHVVLSKQSLESTAFLGVGDDCGQLSVCVRSA